MRNMTSNKRTVWLSKRRVNEADGTVQYDTPIEIKLNLISTGGETELDVQGVVQSTYLKATPTIQESSMLNEMDMLYVFVTKPIITDPLCLKADYQITSIQPGLHFAKVLCKRKQ